MQVYHAQEKMSTALYITSLPPPDYNQITNKVFLGNANFDLLSHQVVM